MDRKCADWLVMSSRFSLFNFVRNWVSNQPLPPTGGYKRGKTSFQWQLPFAEITQNAVKRQNMRRMAWQCHPLCLCSISFRLGFRIALYLPLGATNEPGQVFNGNWLAKITHKCRKTTGNAQNGLVIASSFSLINSVWSRWTNRPLPPTRGYKGGKTRVQLLKSL